MSQRASQPSRPYLFVPLFALFLFPAGLGLAQAPPPAEPAFELERTQWLGKARAGTTVVVVNPFGDVRARFGGYEGVVEVQAVLQHFAAEGPRLVVEPVTGEDGVRIGVGHRSDTGGELSTRRLAGQKKRVDLVVFVPAGVALRTATEDGYTEIRGLKGDVEARSTSGDLQVRSVEGDLSLASESGSIVAVPEPLDRTTTQKLSTRSGGVEVYLYEEAHFTLRAATRGWVSTDFSLTLTADPNDPQLKRAEATIGKGTTPIEVTCGEGHVRLIRKPSATRARAREETP